MYQLVVFDWDGTLMDSALKITRCIEASARDLNLVAPKFDESKQVIGLGLFEAMRTLFPEQPRSTLIKLVEAYKHHFVNADKTPQPLFQDVEDGLERLNQNGVFVAVATGKSRVGLDRVFNETELKRHFVYSRCADESRTKPHPQMLHDILDFTAINPKKAVMIGDTSFDMLMAKSAGIDGLAVSYGVHDRQRLTDAGAIRVVDSFAEVMSFLFDHGVEAPF